MPPLRRLLTAMVTPFNEKGEVDYEQAKKLARALIKSGSDGVVVCGTTGESPTVTMEEQTRLFAEVRQAVGKQGDVVAGAGSNNTAESLHLTSAAERAGMDGVLLVVPYYNKPTQEGMYQHFKAIAASTRLPCILYNVPARTVVNLAPETVIRLSEIDNIVGIKEASGSMDQVSAIIHGARDGFLVWSGNDMDTLPILAAGGYGVISVASHLVGRQMRNMIDKYVGGDLAEAATIHRKLTPLFKTLFIVSNPIPVKYALNHVGFKVGKLRLPLTDPDEKSAAQIRDVLKQYQIDLPLS
ncbi:MAG: 4-hydroxy-tetrahydrodipicolinate synthase [Chloroflexi bacterium]|nr:4-hydroxy-tetrahydrodipicolinate synthase [Chloroflexota bacterium]